METRDALLLSCLFALLGCSDQAPGSGSAQAGSAGSLGQAGGGVASVGGSTAGQNGAGSSGSASGGVGGVAGNQTGGGGGAAGSQAGGAGMAGSAGQDTGPVKHRFLSSISGGGPIAIVSAEGDIEWQVQQDGEGNDAWLLPSGNIVHAYKGGAREITQTNPPQVVWDYAAPGGAEVHSCQPLENDRFLVGETHGGGLAYLLEVDRTGTVQATITVQAPETNLGTHGQFRQVRKTPTGTYIATYIDLGKGREFNAQGTMVREFECGAFVGVRLPDGNTLLACGDDHRWIEVNAANEIVWEVGEQEIPGNQVGFACGVQRLPNGNTVLVNWPGHGGVPANQPQMFEVTRDKELVWEINMPDLKQISTVMILDEGAAVDGRLLR